LAELTKKTCRGIVEPFRLKHGDKPLNRLERRKVKGFLAEKSEAPFATNNLGKRLGQLLDHAIALHRIRANPTRLTKPCRIMGAGFRAWHESGITRFLEVHEPDTVAYRR